MYGKKGKEPSPLDQVLGSLGAGGAAAGTVAGVLAAKAAVDALIKGVTDAVRGAIASGGVFAGEIASASDDPSRPIAAVGQAATNAADGLNKIAPGAGIVVGALGEMASALASVMQALDRTADRYSEYSPAIAQAQAIAEVRQVMGDMRRSREIGPEFVRYIQARTDLQQQFEDIKVRMLQQLLPLVVSIMERLSVIAEVAPRAVAPLSSMGRVMAGDIVGPLRTMIRLQQQMLDKSSDQMAHDPTDVILQNLVTVPSL
jgi:hypothetical protein